ncbi:Asp-tRNA(Asn)/Glu-tRNA(Gln) amidotransferase subunit GatC [Candidatus Amarobacter glycogenicus]
MRDDLVAPSLPQDLALANAPRTEDGYVRVRAVLE